MQAPAGLSGQPGAPSVVDQAQVLVGLLREVGGLLGGLQGLPALLGDVRLPRPLRLLRRLDSLRSTPSMRTSLGFSGTFASHALSASSAALTACAANPP